MPRAVRAFRAALLSVFACGLAAPARAQGLPSEPLVLADGRLTVGGDVSASYGTADPGFFNYTDYEHSALRMLQIDLTGSLTAGEHLTLLGELRSENIETPQAYAFYVRIRPWTDRAFDIEAGRVPPVFGAFARRSYPSDNLLIGYPLAYQYLTSLRADAVPANADELIRMRARGWESSFSIGNLAPDRGVPLASAFRWDTGVQVYAASATTAPVLEGTVAVTTGTIANPLFTDDNSGPQIAGRAAFHPTPGLIVGASASRGPFLSNRASRGAVGDGRNGEFTQTAWGADIEYSRDYFLIRGETIFSRWRLPSVQMPAIDGPLGALGTYVEGRYKIRPGLYAAARVDHLSFSDITGSAQTISWEAPLTRIEIGGGYSLKRNIVVKGSYQRNAREGGRVTDANLGAAQIVFWF
jgi:hypothetical protein